MQLSRPGLGSLMGPECLSRARRVSPSYAGLGPAGKGSLLWGRRSRRGSSTLVLGQEIQGEVQMREPILSPPCPGPEHKGAIFGSHTGVLVTFGFLGLFS